MEKLSLEHKSTHLNAATASDCALHLVLGKGDLAVLALHADGTVFHIEFWEYPRVPKNHNQAERELRRIWKEEPVFQLPFGQKYAALFHPNVTLVPSRMFQHGALPAYFKLIAQPAEYHYAYEELLEFDAYLVYATDKAQARMFGEFFPDTRMRHAAASLLRYVRSMASISEHTVFANLRSRFAQIMVMERQNLLFFNTFEFSTPSDLVYFVLLAYDQFRLDTREVPLTLAGSILNDSESHRMLYRFIREIQFAVPPGQFHLTPDQNNLPGHCLVDLFCLKNR